MDIRFRDRAWSLDSRALTASAEIRPHRTRWTRLGTSLVSLYLPEAPSMNAGLLDCWAAGIGDLVQISFVGPRSLHVLMRSRAVVQRLVFIVSCSSSSSLSSSYNLCGSLSRSAFSGLREEFVHVVPIPLPLTCFHHSRPGIGSALSQREHYSGRPLLMQPPLRLHLGQASCWHVPR